jgi:hypothetical protein
VLETSERAYLESSLLSELPNAPPELSTALAAVLRRNLHAPRHGDRPICDTTHCQVFGQDTASTPGARRRARAAGRAARSLIDSQESWLPFSLGGDESWTETRSLSEVERLLALEFVSLAFRDGRAVLGNDRGGETVLPCELLRNQTRLPRVQIELTLNGDLVIFEGRAGHGLGLDLVSAARDARNGATAREILRKAYSGGFRRAGGVSRPGGLNRSADVTAPKAAQK